MQTSFVFGAKLGGGLSLIPPPDLDKFKAKCDVIVANRWSDDLADVADKVYSRDLFKRDNHFRCYDLHHLRGIILR